jgi:predicted ATP-dependent Lon-type protease
MNQLPTSQSLNNFAHNSTSHKTDDLLNYLLKERKRVKEQITKLSPEEQKIISSQSSYLSLMKLYQYPEFQSFNIPNAKK